MIIFRYPRYEAYSRWDFDMTLFRCERYHVVDLEWFPYSKASTMMVVRHLRKARAHLPITLT
jgi:hypothetical protein